MSRVWVLETHTKGTGANMLPLEKVQETPAPKSDSPFVAPARRERPAKVPEPKPPSKFKIVDVMTRRVLAEGAGARETIQLLKRVRSVVDVLIYVWNGKGGRWRLLPHGEQNQLWDLRGTAGDPPVNAGRHGSAAGM